MTLVYKRKKKRGCSMFVILICDTTIHKQMTFWHFIFTRMFYHMSYNTDGYGYEELTGVKTGFDFHDIRVYQKYFSFYWALLLSWFQVQIWKIYQKYFLFTDP